MFNNFNFPLTRRLKSTDPNVLATQLQSLINGSGSGSGGSSSGGSVLVYNTLTDLQKAYPNGTTQPAWVISDNAWYYWSGAITTPIPSDVTGLSTSNISSSTLTLSWTSSSGATSYDVYNASTLLGNTTSTTYNVSGLSASSSYTFKVIAKNSSGSSAGVTTNATTSAPPQTAPVDVTGLTSSNVASTSLTLSWTASSGATSYDIYENGTLLTNVSTSPYNVTGLTANTSYTFKVVAKNSVGSAPGNGSGATVSATTLATTPADTTPPVVTASPAVGTYTSAQTVTLSATDNSGGAVTIYYTTDGTTPTTSSTVYTAPISINATTTLQYIGKDPSGNISTPVAATYTINAPVQSKYLQMNGTTDWLRLPSMTFDQVVMDVQLGSSTNAYILDARTGIANGQVMNGNNGYSNWGSGISSALKDGVAMNNVTNGTFVANERHVYTFNYTAAGTDNINIFSANNVDQASNTAAVNNSFAGNIYDVKLYNAGTLVAHYDFTTGSLNDQTGTQGKALLTGGTWIGVTQPTTTQYLQLNGTTDYVRVPSNTQLQLTNNFEIKIKAALNDLTQTDAYLLGKYRYGVHKYYSNPNAKIEMLSNGATGTVPAGTMTVSDTNVHTFDLKYDGTTFTTSLDGTNVYNAAASFTFATSNDSVYIGANSYNSGFLKTNVYDVQIFNAETLVAHYDFTKGTAQDQSGNNNNGILTGGTWF